MSIGFFCQTLLLTVLMTSLMSADATVKEKVAKVLNGISDADVDKIVNKIMQTQRESEALMARHMSNVATDPGANVALQALMKERAFRRPKTGTHSISVQSSQSFNGFRNSQPSSWKISESMSESESEQDTRDRDEREPTVTYPWGVGPVLFNQCTERNYSKTSPCYSSKLFDIENSICMNLMDSAAFIGVGFDGRGEFKSESRKASLVQRVCANKATYSKQDVPDTMNVLGIHDTTAETNTFESVGKYMQYIRHKAGVSKQKGVFSGEASKYGQSTGAGYNGGIMGAIGGAIIGGVAGGPAGAAVGAQLGHAIGGTRSVGGAYGSGNSAETIKTNDSFTATHTDGSKTQQASTQNFFAIMFANIILYEITLDEVKPTDLSSLVLKDYMALPSSYYSVGADVKFQNFLLRYGTHFIRSGKFGGQLKITKRLKTSKSMSLQQFSRLSETEFKSMFATLQTEYSQKSFSLGWLGFSAGHRSAKQKTNAGAETSQSRESSVDQQQKQQFQQSEFTQTSVEAQGGTPEIAEAIMNFYSPAFRQNFHEWLASIETYPKPFEFQLRPMQDLFRMSMKDLFPAGNKDFGCLNISQKNLLNDSWAKKPFYVDTRVTLNGEISVNESIRVYCKFQSLDEFQQNMERRRISLEKAIGVYMVEGPFPTSSFELAAGEPGCEEVTLELLNSLKNSTAPLNFSELMSRSFFLIFDMPQPIEHIASAQAKYRVSFKANRWFATRPNEEAVHLYQGCETGLSGNWTKICFRNILLTYEEETGLFHIQPYDFSLAKQRIPSLPDWLSGSTVARIFRPTGGVSSDVTPEQSSVPCNVRWLNSRRLDPAMAHNCIHFTAATEGEIFVIFASVPKKRDTWFYLKIGSEGVAFYHAMKQERSDTRDEIGVLGNKNLYQSFFVCVHHSNGTVKMQFGKTDLDSQDWKIHSSWKFKTDNQAGFPSFYTFGSGENPVSLMDVRLLKPRPNFMCHYSDYVYSDGFCSFRCHAECVECSSPDDNTKCHECRNVEIQHDGVRECLTECPAGYQLSDNRKKLCEPCGVGFYKRKSGNEACEKVLGTFITGTNANKPCEFQINGTMCSACPPNRLDRRCSKLVGRHYLGCYLSPNPLLSSLTRKVSTLPECHRICFAKNFKYAVMQGEQCMCMTDMDNPVQLNLTLMRVGASHCPVKCTGMEDFRCGGENAISVYLTRFDSKQWFHRLEPFNITVEKWSNVTHLAYWFSLEFESKSKICGASKLEFPKETKGIWKYLSYVVPNNVYKFCEATSDVVKPDKHCFGNYNSSWNLDIQTGWETYHAVYPELAEFKVMYYNLNKPRSFYMDVKGVKPCNLSL